MTTLSRHPFELLLEQLTGRMSTTGRPLQHGWGTQADAAHASADRIVWIPAEIDPGAIGYDLGDAGETVGEQLCRFDVAIYGGSPTAVYQLHAELWAWLDLLAGPKQGCPAIGNNPARGGYDIGASKVEPRGGDIAASGWGTLIPVTLKLPVVRRYFPPAEVQAVGLEIVTTNADSGDATVEIVAGPAL